MHRRETEQFLDAVRQARAAAGWRERAGLG